jgi:hypothetical protein
LRDEVLSLLRAQSQASKFMERSAMKVAAHASPRFRNHHDHFTLVGQEIGLPDRKSCWAGGWEKFIRSRLKLGRLVALKVLRPCIVVDAI